MYLVSLPMLRLQSYMKKYRINTF